MRKRVGDCMLICGDFREVFRPKEPVDLFVIDPPYGGIISDDYDKSVSTDDLVSLLYDILRVAEKHIIDGGTLYLFGGVGNYRNRPFFRFLSEVEEKTDWRIHNFITWKKRRGIGTKYNYLFTREEIAMFVYGKKPAIFNVPYLDEERSEEWKKRLKKAAYAPLSDKMRRSNVFTDINELFRGKLVTAEKPERLIEVFVSTSSNEGSLVADLTAGSGTVGAVCSAIGRRSICCERSESAYRVAKKRLIALERRRESGT